MMIADHCSWTEGVAHTALSLRLSQHCSTGICENVGSGPSPGKLEHDESVSFRAKRAY